MQLKRKGEENEKKIKEKRSIRRAQKKYKRIIAGGEERKGWNKKERTRSQP